ncbi:uncharacterized protein ATC70_000035 [Mucor velutinosus]|uniref:Uncharacterized protein n=1 Tax=Mucor velutinosus TaxID=708070 RepID=A0AAN7DAJ5_9FUNG|nr:hypothetical protein ATC70_000035 [Mucor velutinosus]
MNQGWIPAQLAKSLIDQRIPSRDKRLTSPQTLGHTDSQLHNNTAPVFQCPQSQTTPSYTMDHIHNPAPHRYRDPMPDLASNPSNSMKNHSPPTASLEYKRSQTIA